MKFPHEPSASLRRPIAVLFAVAVAASWLHGQQPAQPAPTQAPAAQAPARESPAAQAGAPTATTPSGTAPAGAPEPAPAASAPVAPQPTGAGEVTEEELKQMLVGKQLFLRGGYLGDSIAFNEHGEPVGHPSVGSYTLSGVEIKTIRMSKHKVELIGDRYGLHFLGALPYEGETNASERVKITPRKKVLRITIDREQVVKEKKPKEPRKDKKAEEKDKQAPRATPPGYKPEPGQAAASSETDAPAPEAPKPASETPEAPGSAQSKPAGGEPAAAAGDQGGGQPGSQAGSPAGSQAGNAVAVATEDQAADQASVTTTTSPAHAAKVLRDALAKIFSTGIDDKVRANMPEFWQLYYQAQAAGVDYRSKDPNVQRANAVDIQAKVVTSIAPESNEFAQASGIAGRALYRAVIGPDGKPGEIVVLRPIGFGLDENAVAAIRKATYKPAMKGGQPVAEALDLAVLFRIYSKRTSVAASETKVAEPVKPGPYTLRAQQQAPPPDAGYQPSQQAAPEAAPQPAPQPPPNPQPDPQKQPPSQNLP